MTNALANSRPGRGASVLVRAVLITALTTGVLAALLSWQGASLARKVARDGLTDLAQEVTATGAAAADFLTAVPEVTRRDEIGALARNLDQMRQHLGAATTPPSCARPNRPNSAA